MGDPGKIFLSVIIPLYNRPEEVDELLDTLTRQTVRDFEVLVIEDGSARDAREVVDKYRDRLDIHYHVKPNEGQGCTRNYGFARAKGDYFIIFDSDCLIPPDYMEHVVRRLQSDWLDAYGGPDAAHPSFTPVQKAISYAMTSPFTTGGIRGNKKHVGVYHPRSFNMGISREVWEKTGGFRLTRMGEDIEFSIRVQESGFRTGLIPEAVVYHKRRTDFLRFYRQLHFFGRARINIYKYFPSELKLIHFFPSAFVVFLGVSLLLNLLSLTPYGLPLLQGLCNGLLALYVVLLFGHALIKTRSLKVALMGVWAAFVQLTAYGLGVFSGVFKQIILKKEDKADYYSKKSYK